MPPAEEKFRCSADGIKSKFLWSSSGAQFVGGGGSCKGRNNSDPLHPAWQQCSQGFFVIVAAKEESWAHAGIAVSSLQPLEEQWLVVDVQDGSTFILAQLGSKSSAAGFGGLILEAIIPVPSACFLLQWKQ